MHASDIVERCVLLLLLLLLLLGKVISAGQHLAGAASSCFLIGATLTRDMRRWQSPHAW